MGETKCSRQTTINKSLPVLPVSRGELAQQPLLCREFYLHTLQEKALTSEKPRCARGVPRSHLVNVPPVAGVVVAAPDDVELSQQRGHAVPGPSHWAVCQHIPAVRPGVIALQLLQVILSSPPTRDVHLPIQRRSRVRVHLHHHTNGKARASRSAFMGFSQF